MIYNFNFIYLIPLVIYMFLVMIKGYHMLQQNHYIPKRYILWMRRNIKVVLPLFDILLFGGYCVYAYLNIYDFPRLDYLFAGMFVLLIIKQLLIIRFKKSKKKLVYTNRVKRLLFTTIIVVCGLAYLIYNSDHDINIKYTSVNFYAKICLYALTSYFLVIIVNFINLPFEKLNNYRYLVNARNILKSRPELIKIGITGSFGKTSSKNIINDILSDQYYTLASPKSFNTPMGLTITIRNYLKPLHQLFIAEMGAFKRGEINQLVKLVKPKYGLITSIGPAHLESFGSIENIVLGKFELIEGLPSDGCAILNIDDERIRNYKIKNNCNVLTYSTNDDNADLYAYDIEVSKDGTSFKVRTKKDQMEYKYETKLLGLHSVYNILGALTFAYSLGIDLNKLKRSVRRIKPIEHRLEIKDMGSYTIIDDAFNANPVGSKMALDILGKMPGQKIIITPGMIELGSEQYNLNKKFGEYISEVCDEVILVGKNQTVPIQDGLKEKNYKNYHVVPNIDKAFELMHQIKKENSYILIENDLPDLYDE